MKWSVMGTMANRGLSVVSLILLARAVGVGSFGVWAFAATTAGLIAALSNLGMHIDAQRAINGHTVSPDARRRVRLVMFAVVCTGIIGGGLGSWATSMFEVAADVSPFTWMVAVTIAGIGIASNNFAHKLLIARERIITGFLASDGLRNLSVVIAAFALNADQTNLLWIFSAATIGVSAISWVLLIAIEPTTLFGTQSNLTMRDAVRSGSGVLAVSVVFYLRRQGDVLILGALLSDVEYAIYFAAARLANLVAMGLASLSDPLGPRIGAMFTTNQPQNAQSIVRTVTARSSAIAAIAFIALLLGGGLLLGVFGESFVAGRWVLVLLSGGLLIQALAGPTGMILQFCGGAWQCAGIEGLTAVIGLPLVILAAIHTGINGAAAVAAATTVLCCTLEARAIFKYLGMRSWLQLG
jgi:O-antigen/teichoic acid export membrane protein